MLTVTLWPPHCAGADTHNAKLMRVAALFYFLPVRVGRGARTTHGKQELVEAVGITNTGEAEVLAPQQEIRRGRSKTQSTPKKKCENFWRIRAPNLHLQLVH